MAMAGQPGDVDRIFEKQGQAERGTMVVRRGGFRKVHIPEELQATTHNHVYTDTVDEYGTPGRGYVEVPYEHEIYPVLLYHPNWHKQPEPQLHDFKESFDYQAAHRDWKAKSDRTKVARNAAEEKRLLAKGWLKKPPVVEKKELPSHESDEI